MAPRFVISWARVAPNHRCPGLLAIVLTGCGWLPPDSPPEKPAPPDPDAALYHDWKITLHVLGPRALISETDAAAFHGRTVAISATGYSSPWSGSCDDAHREKQSRAVAEIAIEQKLARDRAAGLGLTDPAIEYRLICGRAGTGRTPPLTVYYGGDHALTCWSGVCYLLAR